MDALHIDHLPALRRPYLLLTFAGWSDAAGVATAAGKFLVQHLQAERFAWIDPEEFYSFTDQRPQARYTEAGQREIIWPANEFYASRQPTLDHDIIMAVGIEPHLKWRTFTSLLIDLIKQCDIYQVVTLGALWADVLYSAPVQFSGSSTDPELARQLGLGTGSRYEGPTGMVGVLHDALRRQQFTSASIWANMPYYISATPNPKGILAVVRRGLEIVGLPAYLPEMEEEARDFDTRVAEAIADDPKIAAHVKSLERQAARPEPPKPRRSQEPEEQVSGEDLAEQFERFLREQRRDQGQN
ncbi:MAG: proteasome assembly chaperone family protein [Candidatus Tectimicrobiota bacterium]